MTQDSARSMHDSNVRYPATHQVIKNYALEFCQLLFAVENPFGFLWSRDPKQTGILILDKYSFNPDEVVTAPAIVANRGPLAWAKSSGFQQRQSYDFKTDTSIHTDLVRGGVTLSCLSRSGIEAENIAGFVFESFQAFRSVLRKIARRGTMAPSYLGYFRVEAATMGEEALVKSNSRPDLSVVPVAIAAMVQRRWAVVPRDARTLRDVNVRTSMPNP